MEHELGSLMLDWYAKHARPLPWRRDTQPYSVWVSEIMLQQTRVETVIPYYEKWMSKFPTVNALASAEEQDVLNIWEGLGYYSRARNMLRTARLVCDQYGGNFPDNAEALLKMPGIGKYTAAAISSIAFGADDAVLDGNVKRVLSRVFRFSDPVNTPSGEKRLWSLADSLLPKGRASEYNQAVMDLGATICTPKTPNCDDCPVVLICEAFQHKEQSQYPVVKEKPAVPHINVCAAIIRRDGKVLIAKRPSKGLLGGLWEFPGGKVEDGETHTEALVREIREELATNVSPTEQFGTYRHAYTHFKVTLQAWMTTLTGPEPSAIEASEIRWVKIPELKDYPMGKIDRMISNDLNSIKSKNN